MPVGYPKMNTSYKQTKYNVTKCASNRRTSHSVRYVVIHYTAGTGTAIENCQYFSRANRNASADYFISKNGEIAKFNGDCAWYFSWHVGDGAGKYGITNANSIGIEVVSTGEEFTQAQKDSLRQLVMAIMADYGVKAENVVRHYDASRKICPKPYCGSTAKDKLWKELHAYITGAATTKQTTNTTTNITTGGNTVNISLPIIKNGSKGNTVKAVQMILQAQGYDLGSYGVDGSFGAATEKAVKAYQKKKGLAADGVVGEKTYKALLT